MQEKAKYEKPVLAELNEAELQDINGGVGFVVVVGAAVAAVVAAVVYTTAAGVTLAAAAAAYSPVYYPKQLFDKVTATYKYFMCGSHF